MADEENISPDMQAEEEENEYTGVSEMFERAEKEAEAADEAKKAAEIAETEAAEAEAEAAEAAETEKEEAAATNKNAPKPRPVAEESEVQKAIQAKEYEQAMLELMQETVNIMLEIKGAMANKLADTFKGLVTAIQDGYNQSKEVVEEDEELGKQAAKDDEIMNAENEQVKESNQKASDEERTAAAVAPEEYENYSHAANMFDEAEKTNEERERNENAAEMEDENAVEENPVAAEKDVADSGLAENAMAAEQMPTNTPDTVVDPAPKASSTLSPLSSDTVTTKPVIDAEVGKSYDSNVASPTNKPALEATTPSSSSSSLSNG